jgi:hypothetical protein
MYGLMPITFCLNNYGYGKTTNGARLAHKSIPKTDLKQTNSALDSDRPPLHPIATITFP